MTDSGYPATSGLPVVIHELPDPETGVLPCCGQLSRVVPTYDRLCRDPAQVTCGKNGTEEK
jgi:hypothetical protein